MYFFIKRRKMPSWFDASHFSQILPANPSELSEKIVALVEDDGLAAAMGNAGRKKAEREFSMKTVADDHLQLYTHLTTCSLDR